MLRRSVVLTVVFLIAFWGLANAQSVGINTSNPDSSAVLDINGNGGVLFPRMGAIERDAIANPKKGLMIFNVDIGCVEIFNGSIWSSVCGAPTLCEFSASPSTGDVYIDKGQTGSFSVDFGVVGGTPGTIFTLMDNATTVPGLTLTSVTNQSGVAPVTQTMNLSVDETAPVGDYTLRFRYIADCGVERVQLITLHITGCDFDPVISETAVNAEPENRVISIPLQITQTGTDGGFANTAIVGTYPNIFTSVTNNGCSYGCVQTLQFTITDSTISGTYDFIIEVVSDCGTTKSLNFTLELGSFRSCKQILDAGLSTGDGVYVIDPDGGNGPLEPTSCYCDMTTDGGGWTLVLNYFHAINTAPALNIRTNNFPLPTIADGTKTFPGQFPPLGWDDHANNPDAWGHTAPSILTFIPIDDIRFYGRHSSHSRVMHFKVDDPQLIEYFKTGVGDASINYIQNNYVTLSSHSANGPNGIQRGSSNQGSLAMTRTPFERFSRRWWVKGTQNSNWEVDETNDAGATIHQIWIR